MKKTMVLSAFMFAMATNAQAVDLQAVLKKALSLTSEAKIAEQTRNSSSYDIDIAKSKFWPTVSAGGSSKKIKKNGNVNADNVTSAYVSIKQNIFKGGVDASSLKVAELNKLIATTKYAQSISAIIMATTKLYFNIISQSQILKSYQLAEKGAELVMQTEKIKFDKGVSDKMAYLEAESSFYNYKSLRVKSQAGLDGLSAEYLRIVGEKPPEVLPLPRFERIITPASLEKAQSQAKSTNLDMLIAKINLLIADENINVAYSQHLPNISLTGSVRRTGNEKSWDAGVEYSVPLYSGGLVSTAVNKAEHNKNLTKEIAKKTESDLSIKVISAWKNFIASKESVVSLEKAMQARSMGMEVSRTRYKNGQLKVANLLKSEEDYINAKKNYYDMLSHHATSMLELLNVTGVLNQKTFK